MVRVTWLAIDSDVKTPITSADSFENLQLALESFYLTKNEKVKCMGFTPHITSFPDQYEGYLTYEREAKSNDKIDKHTDIIEVHCINFFPETDY